MYLRNATIKGSLDASGAILQNTGTSGAQCAVSPTVLDFQHAVAGRSVTFQGSTINGSLLLSYARVATDTLFVGTTFTRGTGQEVGEKSCAKRNDAVDVGSVLMTDESDSTLEHENTVPRCLVMQHLTTPILNLRFATPPSTLNLLGANLGIIEDEQSTWPERLYLDGCSYRQLPGNDLITTDSRLEWLRRDSASYSPFRYDQLMAAYKAAGDEKAVNCVGLAKQHERTRQLGRAGRWWGEVQRVTVGYGYRSERALPWILCLLILGSFVFGIWQPSAGEGPHPPFIAPIYSLDLLVPVLNLGVQDSFTATGSTAWIAWFLRAAGWILTTAFVAGIARRLNRTP